MPRAKYKKQKGGRYQTKVWDGTYTGNSKKHYITVYSTVSSTDLERQVERIKRNVEDQSYVPVCDDTFWEYAKLWRKTFKSAKQKNTQAMYDNIIEKHLSFLDGVKLQDITRTHFQMAINNTLDQPRTCQQISITFKQIIRAAVTDRKLSALAATNICAGIELPKYVPNEKRPLRPEEKAAIKIADFSPQEKAFVWIILGCGLRRGETLALSKFKVNTKSSVLIVNEALAFNGNNPYLKETKNYVTRSVPIPGYVNTYLKDYLKSIPGEYLFTKRNGDLMTKSSYDKLWAQILKKINRAAGGTDELQVVYDLTAHVFRHNYCSNLCYQIPQISIKKIAELMGDTEKMVLEVYNHMIAEKEDPKAAIEAAVGL